jgi:CheY-like chemotaxis protein
MKWRFAVIQGASGGRNFQSVNRQGDTETRRHGERSSFSRSLAFPLSPCHRVSLSCCLTMVVVVTFDLAFLAGSANAQDEGDEAKATTKERPRLSNDPAVQALLATNPRTPAELLNAIDTLIELRALGDAYALVKQLAKTKPDEDAWANLVEKSGSALFLRLGRIEDLQPEGREISDAALAAADRRARDPQRLMALIDQLQDKSAAVRRGAMVRLLSGREAAVQALAAALVDPSRQAQRAAIRTALVQFGRDAPGPLVALLRSSLPIAQTEAIHTLAELGQSLTALDLLAPALLDSSPAEVQVAARDALVKLIGRVPDRDEATAALTRTAKSRFAEALEEADLEALPIVEWHWNGQKSSLDFSLSPPLAEHLDRAANLAGDAARLAPRRREVAWLALAARVEAEAYRIGIDQPAPTGPGTAAALLEAEDVDVLDGMLGYSLANGHTVAAAAAARALGKIARPEVLFHAQPQPGSLVEAARSGDRRLRFAALAAIMQLKPDRPYPGSSLVIEALGYMAGSFAAPRAMVADARSAEVERQAGLLASLGYETDAATNDREVVAQMIASPDYLFALIDFSLAAPTSGALLQRLRRDNRTARLPIGIIASTDDLDAARRLARRTPLANIIYRPVDEAGLQFQVERLLAQAGQRLVPLEERQLHARQAVEWLLELATAERDTHNLRRVYNVRRAEPSLTVALQSPELSPIAAEVLAALGTASSQKSLVDIASQLGRPPEMRQAAAQAFAASVAQYGTLLTTGEIDLQYTRYNRSEQQDAQTQAILASILDAIEARAAADQADQ